MLIRRSVRWDWDHPLIRLMNRKDKIETSNYRNHFRKRILLFLLQTHASGADQFILEPESRSSKTWNVIRDGDFKIISRKRYNAWEFFSPNISILYLFI